MTATHTVPVRVLLIDDDEDEFVLVRDLLEEVSQDTYILDWCADFSEAEAHVIKGDYDAYLVDYRLGAASGVDLISRIRKRELARAMIILTGQGDENADTDAERAGASDYLIKGEINAALLDRSIRYAVASSRSEGRLKRQAQLLQNVHDAVFLIAPDGTIVTWNPGAAFIYGFTAEEMIGGNVSKVFPEGEKDRFSARVYPTIAEKGFYEFVARSIRKDLSEIYVAVRASAYVDPTSKREGVLICANDITPQKRLEQRMLEISEREQRRIGQDIHDDLCQQLAGIGCLAKVIEKQIANRSDSDRNKIVQLGKLIADANVRAREIARGLAQSSIENLGLKGALEELAKQCRIAYEIECHLVECDAIDLSQQVSVQLYRIAQEAVANAVNHGKASAVDFTMRTSGSEVELTISDNGTGFSENSQSDGCGGGLGLMSMHHRADLIGGELTVGGSPTGGVAVSVIFPWSSDDHE